MTGTPTDSVTLGLRKIMDGAPDVILSGVNRGANLGDDVTYSGTVSAAIEGALAGIRSIAFSQVTRRDGEAGADTFEAARGWGAKVLGPLLDTPLPERTLVNVNFPALAAAPRSRASARSGRGSTTIRPRDGGRGARPARVPLLLVRAARRSSTRSTTAPIWRRSTRGSSAVTPLQLDLTHHSARWARLRIATQP